MMTSTLNDGEPAACERCKQLEEHAYDLVGQLRVANIKLAYTHPPQRTWVGLTDMERQMTINQHEGVAWETAIAIEQQLKEKNT
jgi:hypothetical protein